jgi:hypothetical protein
MAMAVGRRTFGSARGKAGAVIGEKRGRVEVDAMIGQFLNNGSEQT